MVDAGDLVGDAAKEEVASLAAHIADREHRIAIGSSCCTEKVYESTLSGM